MEVKPIIVVNAELSYGSRNKDRFETFKIYLNRIYHAYFSGKDSDGRMNILYNGISNPKVMLRLRQIKEQLQQKLQWYFYIQCALSDYRRDAYLKYYMY